MTARDEATLAAYSLGWWTVRKMPEKTAYATFDRIADRLWSRRGGGVTQLEQNLRRVCREASDAQIRELSRAGMRNYFRYWCDAFRMPDWSPERIIDTFRCENEEILAGALAAGRGAIVAVGHMGNWDHTGAWGTLVHAPVTAIAERLEPERLFQRFVAYRESIGIRIYPIGQPNVIDTLADELRTEGRIVALVADRDLTARGVSVTFFGEETRMPAGPANLALRTGAPLIPATLWYDGPTAVARMHSPVAIPPGAPTGDRASTQPGYDAAVTHMTQQMADVLAEGIAAHPTDWHMLQKLWLADLDQDRLARSDDAAATLPAETKQD